MILVSDTTIALSVRWPDRDGLFPGDVGFRDEVEPRYPVGAPA